MKLALVQIYPWDRPSLCEPSELTIEIGQRLLVETDSGQELGRVLGFKYLSNDQLAAWSGHTKKIVRLANSDDCQTVDQFDKTAALSQCQQFIDQCQLEMKLIDAAVSADNRRLTFAFTAEGRIDFRELVRLLTRNFNKQIRLQQIGTRDEAKLFGGQGVCGRGLCCRGFLTELSSVTSDMAEIQGINHRGSERISGICGRLMCCLAYEAEGYQAMAQKLPNIGDQWKVNGQLGQVINRHILKGTIIVEFHDSQAGGQTVVEITPGQTTNKKDASVQRRWIGRHHK
ncbi:MAG TPA: regulatory iron-sulfur-containing complex subunit RicT [bacterium]|jgi:cell fate regulator YaaT (PSP1 superfamily)|nr:regulatory iron-sulfur-containing complex subunit RicT [bacterium]HNZ51375.1 regulatory iron-sulfur-containing complex subunit RicT [bacterium]HOF79337.1 regulatory iron-sulfur-containing complex subunit RicT [bacterium]HOH85461.1 regulatory iron-sulfur-containing complex subunit RicT [bacterium]HOQ91540.1 regulatory iron-sulfur-containing complex subunit RicT [bacterium]